MNTLDRLILSDLKRMWGQVLAICSVLACGVGTYVMSTSTLNSLEITCDDYYRKHRFAEVFVNLTRAPDRLKWRLQEIPGVDEVQTRVVRDVILDVPGMIEPATCRLISIPDSGEPVLNSIYLQRGRYPDPRQRGEVIASETFATAHNLRPGDEVRVIMGGREEKLRVVGIGLSPEYIYSVQPGQMLPDNEHFGVLWMAYTQIAAVFNMEGAFNDASLTLQPGTNADEVLARVDELTKPYGGVGAFVRYDQISHRRVADEMQQMQGMGMVWPAIFFSVAAFLFNLVFSRMINQQQEEIATLRAFGYGPLQIGLHYTKLLVLLVGFGVLLGTAVGIYLFGLVFEMYGYFFRFPVLHYAIAWNTVPIAAGASLFVGFAGGYSSIRRAMRLPPAVAMRPPSPGRFRPSLMERLGLGIFLSPIARMVFRRLERNLLPTGLSILGMAFGAAVLVMGSYMEDTINYVIDVQFQRTQRQDVMLTFNEVTSAEALYDARHLPGVRELEPFRSASVKMVNGVHARRQSIMGLVEHPQLFRVLDEDLRPVPIITGGLTVSEKLAELLGVTIGETVDVEFLEGKRPRHRIPVVAIFKDYANPAAYMLRDDLHRLLQEGQSLSGVFLTVDAAELDNFHREVKQTPTVAAMTLTQAALDSFRETISDHLGPMRTIYAVFASIIAFGVIYNCALMTMAERSRDLATLRVLGFTNAEVSGVLLGELAVITLASLPIGLPLGYGLCYIATLALDTETQRFPLIVSWGTFAYAAMVILIAATLSALIVRRMIDRLNLIGVLKVRE